ncbi:retrovirus-related pol polyprotein from transposon TNT 1-94 [Tanacetum coccineum]
MTSPKDSVDPTLSLGDEKDINDLILVQIYVDDIIFAASTPELCDLFAKIMCSKFKMSMMGKISFFLGLQISQSPRGIFINQSKYALESLKKYGYESCDPVDTPHSGEEPFNTGSLVSEVILPVLTAFADAIMLFCQDNTGSSTSGHSWAEKELNFYNKLGIAEFYSADTLKQMADEVDEKCATLQVVYDVLKITPFYKAFQVTADAPEIYMQEFWASAYVHNRSVRFKMNNKKHIIGLEQFRDILQICPKVGNKKFVDPPLEKEILIFLASLGHSGDIRKLTDVNVNKLACNPGDHLLQNVDYAYLLWEDFIFKIENKNTKKGSAMYYPRFTKLVVNFVMEKDPSIPRRNKVNWHYARDDPMFTTINVISRNEATQLYGAILPVALTNEDIRNSESYKEYYARASGTIPPKTKGSKKKATTDIITQQKPPTAPKEKKSGKGKQKTAELETISEADLTEAEQLKIITKRSRQETHSSHASGSGADEGTGVIPGVPDAPDYDSEDDISWKSSDDDQDDEQSSR